MQDITNKENNTHNEKDEKHLDEKSYIPALPITVHLQPEEKIIEIPRYQARTVKRLFDFLGIKLCTAIVVRNETLLTPDLPLFAGDKVLVRKIQSTG